MLKRINTYRVFVALLALFLAAAPAQAASFDCAKAATRAEKTICADPALSGMDEELAKTYAQAKEKATDKDALTRAQRTWVKSVRDACPDNKCMLKAYLDRIAKLQLEWEGQEKQVQAKVEKRALGRIPADMPCIGANNLPPPSPSGPSYQEANDIYWRAECVSNLLKKKQFDLVKQIINAGHPKTRDWGEIMFKSVADIPEYATDGRCKTGEQRYEGKELEEIMMLLVNKGIQLNADSGFVDNPNTMDFVGRITINAEQKPACINKARAVDIINSLLDQGFKTNNFSEVAMPELEWLGDLDLLERVLRGGIHPARKFRVKYYFHTKTLGLVKLYEKYGYTLNKTEFVKLVKMVEYPPAGEAEVKRDPEVLEYFRVKSK